MSSVGYGAWTRVSDVPKRFRNIPFTRSNCNLSLRVRYVINAVPYDTQHLLRLTDTSDLKIFGSGLLLS